MSDHEQTIHSHGVCPTCRTRRQDAMRKALRDKMLRRPLYVEVVPSLDPAEPDTEEEEVTDMAGRPGDPGPAGPAAPPPPADPNPDGGDSG